jgi:hypothetical protein
MVSAIMKNEFMLPVGKWMELEIITLSEISETQKYKYCIFPLICGIKTKKMNNMNVKQGLFGSVYQRGAG